MTQNSTFAKEVRCALVMRDWTLADLAASVTEKTGLYCDAAYLSRILSGVRSPQRIVAAISEILGLSSDERGG